MLSQHCLVSFLRQTSKCHGTWMLYCAPATMPDNSQVIILAKGNFLRMVLLSWLSQPFFLYYTVYNLWNHSVSLSCVLALLSVVLAARNNFLLVAVIVFVKAPYFVRSATLEFLYAWYLVLHMEYISISFIFEDICSCASKRNW